MRTVPARTLLLAGVVLVMLACGGPPPDATVGPDEPMPTQPEAGGAAAPGHAGATAVQDRDAAPAAADDALRQPATREAGDVPGHDASPAPSADDAEGPGALAGRWRIVGHRMSARATIDVEMAERLHGRELAYAPGHAESGEDRCDAPRYHLREVGVLEQLLAEHGTSPLELELGLAADAGMQVIDVECTQPPWSTLGDRVMLLPGGRVLAPWQGVFFDLVRR